MSDEKKPRKKTGGRVAGVPNKRTLIGKSVSETLANWLGFDSAAVERGMIDGKGYRGRLKLKAMWDGERPIDPQFIMLCKFLFSYAYGTPSKHVIDKVQKDPVIFVAQHGYLPWDSRVDPGHQRSLDLIARKEAEEKLRALEAGKPEVVIDQEPEGETLEAVVPPPEPPEIFDPGSGRGR